MSEEFQRIEYYLRIVSLLRLIVVIFRIMCYRIIVDSFLLERTIPEEYLPTSECSIHL